MRKLLLKPVVWVLASLLAAAGLGWLTYEATHQVTVNCESDLPVANESTLRMDVAEHNDKFPAYASIVGGYSTKGELDTGVVVIVQDADTKQCVLGNTKASQGDSVLLIGSAVIGKIKRPQVALVKVPGLAKTNTIKFGWFASPDRLPALVKSFPPGTVRSRFLPVG